jgi:hypothetical protein
MLMPKLLARTSSVLRHGFLLAVLQPVQKADCDPGVLRQSSTPAPLFQAAIKLRYATTRDVLGRLREILSEPLVRDCHWRTYIHPRMR